MRATIFYLLLVAISSTVFFSGWALVGAIALDVICMES